MYPFINVSFSLFSYIYTYVFNRRASISQLFIKKSNCQSNLDFYHRFTLPNVDYIFPVSNNITLTPQGSNIYNSRRFTLEKWFGLVLDWRTRAAIQNMCNVASWILRSPYISYILFRAVETYMLVIRNSWKNTEKLSKEALDVPDKTSRKSTLAVCHAFRYKAKVEQTL